MLGLIWYNSVYLAWNIFWFWKTELSHKRTVWDSHRLLISQADSLIWPLINYLHMKYYVNDVYCILYISSSALTSVAPCPSLGKACMQEQLATALLDPPPNKQHTASCSTVPWEARGTVTDNGTRGIWHKWSGRVRSNKASEGSLRAARTVRWKKNEVPGVHIHSNTCCCAC